MTRRETDRDRLIALVKSLAHPTSGADLVAWETEALALIDKLIRPRWAFWEIVKGPRRWLPLLLVLVPLGAQAQIVTVGPVDTSMRFEWNPPDNVTTTADALTFEWRLRDGTFIPVTALTSVTCAGTPIVCQSGLTQSNVDALNRVGQHSLTLSAFRADVGDSQASLPFSLRSAASAPTNLSITR